MVSRNFFLILLDFSALGFFFFKTTFAICGYVETSINLDTIPQKWPAWQRPNPPSLDAQPEVDGPRRTAARHLRLQGERERKQRTKNIFKISYLLCCLTLN